ncbi:hypothetical protein C1645_325835 [Glomus cerebriforme]|uniref:Uncharacterized protein n=1 Tax=Glomus cerebriforme TaxID=658196 RepID=A0A397SKH2_9GLOM|nr:hypothetical protein C1645_325835 [Glomus cerebriforme]
MKLMNENRLIELLEDLSGSQNDYQQKQNDLLVLCLNAPRSELEKFFDELSQLLDYTPETYLPTLQTFISHIYDKNSGAILNINLRARWNTTLPDFISLFITNVIIKNLHHSDIPSFGELLHNCIELLWRANKTDNKYNNKPKLAFETIKFVFCTILDTDNVLEVLVSGPSGHHCINRILFDFKMINQFERKELLKAVNVVAALLEECSEHNEGFFVYNACATLLKTLKRDQSAERALRNIINSCNNLESLSILGVAVPQKTSDLPNFLQVLEQKKIDSFRSLMELLPCANCHEQALICFSPDKYSSLMAGRESMNIGRPERLFDLPFEFDDEDRLGPWDILLSEDVIKDMRKLESPLKTDAVMKKLGQLSSGAWNKYGFRHIALSHTIPVYEIELLDDSGLKILWQVDYGFSIRSYLLTQLVKVWAVTASHERIRETLENLEMVRRIYTAQHIHRCTVEQNEGIILPKIFEDEEIKSMEYGSQIDDERLLEVHKMLVTNKFIPLSKNLFKSLVMGGSNFTFQVSKIEYEIINNPTSAIIIGRSGTGKTTCILFRQIASYLKDRISSLHNNYKRQIFITVSYNLCRRVKEYFNQLQESAIIARRKMSMEQVHEYVRKKDEEKSSKIDSDNIMLEDDDEEEELSDIPNSFHHLTDKHFPLFITYNKLSKMLQGTYGIDIKKLTTQQKLNTNYNAHENKKEEFFQGSSFINTINASWAHFVNYETFQKRYWDHFSDYYRQKFDCELVYSEFSVIKGLNPEVDYLSKEEYQAISTKKYPAFCHNRDQIYDLFQRYEKMKAGNRDYDSMDRTLAILRCAKTQPLGGPHIHEVYIDECQDNHIVDFALILKIFDRADSIFFAGDTAQCIAQGSSFRFQDIRSLIYQWELNRTRVNYNLRGSMKPKQFELNINYRSHNGILQLASSVIDLIWHFFPNSIDRLSRERGKIDGPLPIIFEEFQAETFHYNIFSIGEHASNVEFGAEQVIIVRNDAAKKRVKELIGKVGLVMTVFEAKGMEFNDVLLYDFFTDSPARSKWRVILSALDDHSKGVQTFSHEKHYILSSELKHLYVAVTRARQHIWIFDKNTEWSKPIRTYWDHHGLVKVIRNMNEISTFPTLAKKSSSHEWNRRGRKFFEHQQYEQAIFCFEKSGSEEFHKIANAYRLQQIARASVNDSDEITIKSNFIRAAQAFKKCSRPIQAVSCYQDIDMYDEAGNVYAEWKMFEPAAHCYRKAKIWHKSGKYFEKVKKYRDAALAYLDGGYYEIAVNLIQSQESQEIDEETFNHITHIVKNHYRDTAISYGKFEEAADMFIRLTYNEKDIIEALEFLLYLCRIKILEETMSCITSPYSLQQYFLKTDEFIMKFKSQLINKSQKWDNLIEEFQLYSAYLNKNFNEIYQYIQLFRRREELANEFRAITIWLKFLPQAGIQAEYWHERLQYLLRLCELAFSFIANVNVKTFKNFDHIFCTEVKNSQRRQIPFDSPLLHFINEKRGNGIEKAEKTMNDQHIYDMGDVHMAISQCLASYITDLIQDVSVKGRNIPDINSQICYKFTSCTNPNCQNHHVFPTPSILYQRLTLALLQYTVILKLDVLYHRRLLKEEQSKIVRPLISSWTEKLVQIHMRYQTPQTSCPEVTYMIIAKLPELLRNGFIQTACKLWIREFNDASNFYVILKCMFVLQQLRDEWSINRFDFEMSKTKTITHPENLPIGFEYYTGYNEAIPVGKRLSLFFFHLYSNNVIDAILNIRIFIQYAISNSKSVNLVTPHAFGDLISLMEFTTSLVFTKSTEYCDFCLPRAYLVNYFEAFTAKPLIPSYNYSRENYLNAIKDSFDQAKQLLSILICSERAYSLIILRLIRLLVLIGLNESTFALKVFNLFKYLNSIVSSGKVKRYLEERCMGRLVNVLHNDIKETGCDSLIIVYYQCGDSSRFSNLEKYGIVKLTYNSIEGFHSALQRIILSAIAENNEQFVEEEMVNEIQAWFWLRIYDSPQTQKAVRKIQTWFRQIQNPRQPNYLDKIYNDVMVFCKSITGEEEKCTVRKYNILLRGLTVDTIVKLIDLQGEMNTIKNKLKFLIQRYSQNVNKVERYSKLEEERKFVYSLR